MKFDPRRILKYLGFDKMAAKTHPYQSLFWHCLNTYSISIALEESLPAPLTEEGSSILRLTALLHDAGKTRESWQTRGKGRHSLRDKEEEVIREVLTNPELFTELPNERELEIVLDLITEHHVRKTDSYCDVERIMTIVKIADTLASAETISARHIDELTALFQPEWLPVVLTAEEHPISYFTLSLADELVSQRGGRLIVTNPLQSLYFLPSGIDIDMFEDQIIEMVESKLRVKAESSSLFRSLGSRASTHPVVDEFLLWIDLGLGGGKSLDELRKEIQRIRDSIGRSAQKNRPVDSNRAWYPPIKLLYRISKDLGLRQLVGTDIPLSEVCTRRYPDFSDARRIGERIGAKNPESLAEIAVEILRREFPRPDSPGNTNLDILTWSNRETNAGKQARESYEYYKQFLWSSPIPTSWSSRPLRRNTKDYCFSCKTRPPMKKAPVSHYFKTDTWTSSVSEKGPVQVCELCFLARAHVLELSEPCTFHVQFTPPYNQARLDWKNLLDTGLSTETAPLIDLRRWDYVNAHRVIVPLSCARTPGDALKEVFLRSGRKKSIADFVYENGLSAVVSSGPSHTGSSMLSGMGVEITPEEWEKFGRLMQLLVDTSPGGECAVRSLWLKINRSDKDSPMNSRYGYGTELAVRHRAGMFKSKERAKEVTEIMDDIGKEEGQTIFDYVARIPLYTGDREDRFKSAESMLRRMEAIVRRASRQPDVYGGSEREIVELIAQVGKKQLRTRIEREKGEKEWRIRDEQLQSVDEALRQISKRLWALRGDHVARGDLINACIMRMAYRPKEEG